MFAILWEAQAVLSVSPQMMRTTADNWGKPLDSVTQEIRGLCFL